MSFLEKYELVEMHRSELKKHPLNPRRITAEAKRRLKDGLERFGLVSPLIFNRKTGLLVGGHQRLACMDDIEGTKDYSLKVAVVDIDETKEKELVVFLNNTSAQGFWDETDLLDIINDSEVSKESLGFSSQEMDYFDKLMQETSKDEEAAIEYMNQMLSESDSLEQAASDAKEEIEQDKESKKMKWEKTISGFFEPAPPSDGANAKADDELTQEEREHRKEFRDSRENWKKQDGSSEVVVRIIFTNADKARFWLSKNKLPTNNFLLHEKELD